MGLICGELTEWGKNAGSGSCSEAEMATDVIARGL